MNEQYYDAVLHIKQSVSKKGLTSLCIIIVMNRRRIAD